MSIEQQDLVMLGVDVAKDKLDVAMNNQQVTTINNNEAAFNRLIKSVANKDRLCFVMEAMGHCH